MNLTYDDAFRKAERVLRSVAATFGLELPRLRFSTSDPDQVAQALSDAGLAVQAATAGTELDKAATIALTELSTVRLDLMAWKVLRSHEAPQLLRRSLERFRAASTVAELFELIPARAADLGYDRVLLSWVDRGRWIPCRACTRTDPAEAEALVTAGRGYRSTRSLLEDQVVRGRSTILVRDVQGNPRVHAELLAASGSRAYVATPLVVRGRVVGLLHADRNAETGTMDEFDRDLLELLSEGLRITLDRAAALADLETVRGTVQTHAVALHELLGRLGHDQDLVIGGATGGPAGMPGADGPRWQALPSESALGVPGPYDADEWRDDLTRREEQVLRLVADGLTNAQIGKRLFVTEGTVKSHVKSLMRKLDVATRSEAGALYHRHTQRAALPPGR